MSSSRVFSELIWHLKLVSVAWDDFFAVFWERFGRCSGGIFLCYCSVLSIVTRFVFSLCYNYYFNETDMIETLCFMDSFDLSLRLFVLNIIT